MEREFIYTNIFQKNWNNNKFTESDLMELEQYLLSNPSVGDIIESTGGLRKMRYALQHKGKSGGIRILYVDFVYYEKIFLINCYSKKEKENIGNKEKAIYKSFIKEIENELKNK